MIQDIAPRVYHNEYHGKTAEQTSFAMIFAAGKVLCSRAGDGLRYPTFAEAGLSVEGARFLFSIDETDFFLPAEKPESLPEGFTYEPQVIFRTAEPRWLAFAGFVAGQLGDWYRSSRFCGRCGKPMRHSEKERMMQCPDCGNMVYPKICPGVIVAVTNGEKLLLSKYAGRAYASYALIAGFTEIGEPIEKTVEREVLEEVGLRVKNITFYKSQPWAFSSSLLCGFFAELDGDDTITLEEEELAEAGWFTAEEIDLGPDQMSLTREMMMKFKAEHQKPLCLV